MRAIHAVGHLQSCDYFSSQRTRLAFSQCHRVCDRMNEHARRYPAGNIPATADFRDCCRNISEQASRSTNDGGVGAGSGGPHWSHDALGAYTYFDYSYTASMKKHLQNAFAHSSLPHSCCKKYFGQLHDSTAQGRWHAGVLRGHPPLGEETLDGVHAGHRLQSAWPA